MIGTSTRRVLFSLWHWAKRDGVNDAISELAGNQWLPVADLRALQRKKLSALLTFAVENVPYYRSLATEKGLRSDAEGLCDRLSPWPPLTKEIIHREKRNLISEDLSGNGLVENSTSGSTGEALRFYTDCRSLPYRQADALRSRTWAGGQLGDRTVAIWGAPIDQKMATKLRGRLHGWVTGSRLLSSFDLSASRMDDYARKITKFKPRALVGYPGPLEEFASHCLDRGIRFPSLNAIISSAETLWPYQREIIEDAFAIKVFNRYGCREIGHIASECSGHDGLHISVDRVFAEVVDDLGLPCDPGDVGRILVTDLDNFGMPLIRYDIGDRGSLGPEQACTACGRTLPKFKLIEGRTMDLIRTPNGQRVGGTYWTLLLKSKEGLKQIQVIQNRLDEVEIHFIRDTGYDPCILNYFAARIQERCGTDLNVRFVERESIDTTASGKRRLIISNLGESRKRQNVNATAYPPPRSDQQDIRHVNFPQQYGFRFPFHVVSCERPRHRWLRTQGDRGGQRAATSRQRRASGLSHPTNCLPSSRK